MSDAELHEFGYAPGGYTSKCLDCGAQIWHVDKRCYVCRSCAVNRRLKAMTDKPVAGASKTYNPLDLIVGLCEAQIAQGVESAEVEGARGFAQAVLDIIRATPETPVRQYTETQIREFCGFVTGDLPQLHTTHPEALWQAWQSYLECSAQKAAAPLCELHQIAGCTDCFGPQSNGNPTP